MFVVQQNCDMGYECTISTLEAALGLDASAVCIQKPFIENWGIFNSGLNLYWLSGTENRKDIRVLMAFKKDILSNVVIENRTDLLDHPYCMVLDIKELHPQSRNLLRKTRVVNLYDNKIGREQRWERSSPKVRQAI